MSLSVSEKIALLNQTTMDSLVEKDYLKIVAKFIDTSVKILGADFGYAWWKIGKGESYELIYKTANMTYVPKPPRKKGTNYTAVKKNLPHFVGNPRKEILPHMKSYIIMPISYGDHQYGSLVLCFKTQYVWNEEAKGLSLSLGNSAAQAITIHRLIQEQKETARKNEEFYRYLVQLSPHAIFVHSEAKFQFLNAAAVALFGGKSHTDIIGKPLAELIHPDYHDQMYRRMKMTFEDKQDLPPIEYKIVTLKGEIKTVEIASNPITYQDRLAAQGVIVDITRHKEKEELLRIQRETLVLKEKLDQEEVRKKFIADATHELRTPLAIIQGEVELALRGREKRAGEKTFHTIHHEVEHLSELMTDLTLLNSSDQNFQRKILSHDADLSKIIANVTKRLTTLAHKKNIKIQIKDGHETMIQGDKFYLEKLFLNLVRNSIIYGKEGGKVLITLSKTKNKVKVEVTDDGIGISKEDQTRIFERFFRTDMSRNSNTGGSGLGLAIAKWVVDKHNGTISVISTLGKGSTFRVILPLKSA